jgi:hypothetical protein
MGFPFLLYFVMIMAGSKKETILTHRFHATNTVKKRRRAADSFRVVLIVGYTPI